MSSRSATKATRDKKNLDGEGKEDGDRPFVCRVKQTPTDISFSTLEFQEQFGKR